MHKNRRLSFDERRELWTRGMDLAEELGLDISALAIYLSGCDPKFNARFRDLSAEELDALDFYDLWTRVEWREAKDHEEAYEDSKRREKERVDAYFSVLTKPSLRSLGKALIAAQDGLEESFSDTPSWYRRAEKIERKRQDEFRRLREQRNQGEDSAD